LLLKLNKLKQSCKQAKSKQSLAGPEASAVRLNWHKTCSLLQAMATTQFMGWKGLHHCTVNKQTLLAAGRIQAYRTTLMKNYTAVVANTSYFSLIHCLCQ